MTTPEGQGPEISVVLPVHAGVSPDELRRSLESLGDQTLPASEVVVVEDGPLPQRLRDLLDELGQTLPLRRVALEHNQGAGVANQAGLAAARGEWIAKADADDVNLPHRLRTQLDAVQRSGVDLCGAAMLEFVGEEDQVHAVRSAPLTHDAIARRMRVNNPVNHPTAFYRRSAALAAGGYPPWRYMQDYGLFARMLADGSSMMNLGEPLVLFRTGGAVTRRRRSADIRRLEVVLQKELQALGIVGRVRRLANTMWRTVFRLLPASAVSLASRRLLSKPISDTRRTGGAT